MNKPKIEVAVVGAQKAASTSLHRYMAMHPAFTTHPKLEFTYFVRDEEFQQGYEKAFSENFPEYHPGQKILVKNVGLMYWKKAAERLHEHHPDMKLIVVLRHPAERAWSAFHYAQQMGVEDLEDFEQALGAGPARFKNPIDYGMVDYLGRGHYADQIRFLQSLFPPANIMIVLQDELQSNPEEVLKKCFEFCGVDSTFKPDFSIRFNEAAKAKHPGFIRMLKRNRTLRSVIGIFLPKGTRSKLMAKAGKANRETIQKKPMDPGTRQKLVDYFRPLNDELSKLTGKDLTDWNQ